MPRLFLGIGLPDPVQSDIEIMAGGIPGARWQTRDQLHLTLHFLGEVDGGEARRLSAALEQLDAPSFTTRLSSVGVFPLRGQARSLWAGVADPEPFHLIHARSGRILDQLGIERERRKFHPHATLARLKHADPRRLGEWISGHALYASPSFVVDEVRLYSSVLSQAGAKYRIEAAYPLTPPDEPPDEMEPR